MSDNQLDPLAASHDHAAELPPVPPPRRGGAALVVGAAALAALAGAAVTLAVRPPSLLPAPTTTRTEVAPTPDVVLAIQDLARLESVTYHVERVVDLADHEKHLYGLVDAKDAILLVAVGDVVAGCDLSKLPREDVQTDFAARRVTVRLPKPVVLSAKLDEQATHVYARRTDTLATRHEDLEQRARQEAVRTMQRAAENQGILDKARANTEAAIRGLLEATGFKDITITFAD